jgi:hypothetical protein
VDDSFNVLATFEVPAEDAEEQLFVNNQLSADIVADWVHATKAKNFYELECAARVSLLREYLAEQKRTSTQGVQTASAVADKHHATKDSATTISTVSFEGTTYELRICSIGADAYFEWIDDQGDPIGDMFYELTPKVNSEFIELMTNAVPARADVTKTVYCIALEGDAETGSDWFSSKVARDLRLGATGAELEVPFEMPVPFAATHQEITDLVDSAAWDKTFFPPEQL